MDNFLLKDSMLILNDLSPDVKVLWKTKKCKKSFSKSARVSSQDLYNSNLSIILITSFYSSSG